MLVSFRVYRVSNLQKKLNRGTLRGELQVGRLALAPHAYAYSRWQAGGLKSLIST